MITFSQRLLVLVSFAFLLACGGKPAETPVAPAPGQTDEHRQAAGESDHGKGAKPGSHEDWCGEHGVPESQCTRCNATLIAAFKATGDWCGEHALPESQCTNCNPNLKIVRPPKTSP